MSFLTTNRGRFFYEHWGDRGPAIHLLHGLTANHAAWEPVAEKLAGSGYQVFAFDLRGHGKSDRPWEGYSPDDHALDFLSWMEGLGQQKAHLVGHSASGRNALVFAVTRPERTLSLTIIDQALGPDPERWQQYKAIYDSYPTPFQDEESLDRHLRGLFADEKRFSYYKSLFQKDGQGRWDWDFSTKAVWETQRLGRQQEYFSLIPQVKVPVLFVKAGQSRHVSSQDVQKLERLLKSGCLRTVEGTGHAVHQDDPEGFLGVLTPFLAGS